MKSLLGPLAIIDLGHQPMSDTSVTAVIAFKWQKQLPRSCETNRNQSILTG